MAKDLELKIQELEAEKIKLAESEEKYRLIVENANDAMIVLDLKGNFLNVNKKAEEISGYKREELLKMNMRKLIPKYYLPKLLFSFVKVLHEEKFMQPNLPLYTKDKKIVYTEVNGSLFKKDSGSKIVVGIIRDVTERRKYEEELRMAEEKYHLILENANDAVFTADLKGKILSVNKKAEEFSGYTVNELEQMNIRSFFSTSYLPTVLSAFAKVISQGHNRLEAIPFICKDKKIIYVDIHASLLRKNGKPYAIGGTIIDITNQKQHEQNLRDKIDELERYNRITIGREQTMMELKKRVNELEEKLAEKE